MSSASCVFAKGKQAQVQGAGAGQTVGGDAAAAPEDGAVEEADEEGHKHPREVVGGAAPVGQPELARQRDQLGESVGRVGARHLDLGVLLLPLGDEVLYQLLVLQVQLALLYGPDPRSA